MSLIYFTLYTTYMRRSLYVFVNFFRANWYADFLSKYIPQQQQQHIQFCVVILVRGAMAFPLAKVSKSVWNSRLSLRPSPPLSCCVRLYGCCCGWAGRRSGSVCVIDLVTVAYMCTMCTNTHTVVHVRLNAKYRGNRTGNNSPSHIVRRRRRHTTIRPTTKYKTCVQLY